MASKLMDISNTEAEAQKAASFDVAVEVTAATSTGSATDVLAAASTAPAADAVAVVGVEPATRAVLKAPEDSAALAAWYAVSVEPGTELACAEILRAALANAVPDVECFAPLYRTQRKVAGEYVDEELPLIPGCICVVCEDATAGDAVDSVTAGEADGSAASTSAAAIRTAVRRTGIGTSARYAVEPLHEVLVDWLAACTTPGQRVVDASAGVADGKAVRVTAGPLAHKEQWIRKVNHRKKCAYLDIPAGARSIHAQTGLKLARA